MDKQTINALIATLGKIPVEGRENVGRMEAVFQTLEHELKKEEAKLNDHHNQQGENV